MSHHDHFHAHGPRHYNRTFAIAVSLNLAYVFVEVWFAYASHSLALFSDAMHNLSDVVALLIPWSAIWIARKSPNLRHTYGFGRATVLASLISAILLIVTAALIAWEAVERLGSGATTQALTIILVAAIGIVINGVTTLMFLSGRQRDINIRGAYLHMLADTMVSVGVVVAGIGIMLTAWYWLDSAVSLLISLVIVWGAWGLLKESTGLIMDGVPAAIDPLEVRAYIESCDAVTGAHDLHIWAMSSTDTALTAHVVVNDLNRSKDLLKELSENLNSRFGIRHTTVQVELADSACRDSCENGVQSFDVAGRA